MRWLPLPVASLARALWDDLFPLTCPGCDVGSPGGATCARCRLRVAPIEAGTCLRHPSPLAMCLVGAAFEGLCAERLRAFKYPPTGSGFDPGPERFATWLVAQAARRAGAPPDAVIPVPHHPRRLRHRGFVPALLLARHVATAAKVPCRPELLRRVRDTPSQTSLGRLERRENVRGAFSATRRVPPTVWLVDDVITTGATLEEAARALKTAGAARVTGIAAAQTPNLAPRRET